MSIFLKLFIRDYEKAQKHLHIEWIGGDPQYVHTWNLTEFRSEPIDTYPREVLMLTPSATNFEEDAFEIHAKELSKELDCLVQTRNGFYENGTLTSPNFEFSPSDILAAVVQFRKIHLQFVIDSRRHF